MLLLAESVPATMLDPKALGTALDFFYPSPPKLGGGTITLFYPPPPNWGGKIKKNARVSSCLRMSFAVVYCCFC